MKLMTRLGVIFDGILNATAFLAGILLIALMLLVTVAVGLRYFLHRPIGWSVEVSQYMMVCMGYIVIAWVLRRERHVKVDVLLNTFSQKTQALVNTTTSGACTLVSFIVALSAAGSTWDLYRTHYFTPTILMVPEFIFIAVIAFGCFLLSLQFARRTYAYSKSLKSQNAEE
jgi:TRAP-type C4-dicarboxylate transport system permease small subunit